MVDNDAALFVAGVCIFTLVTGSFLSWTTGDQAFDTAAGLTPAGCEACCTGLFLALLVNWWPDFRFSAR